MNPAPVPVVPTVAVVNVTVNEAEPLLGPDGAVEWWDPPISDSVAVTRLKGGEDIVVRGPIRRANRNKAMELMTLAYGGFDEDGHHGGRMSLPHFHPPDHDPDGVHAFFEAPPRHAKKRK
jgi:hypothetical protein